MTAKPSPPITPGQPCRVCGQPMIGSKHVPPPGWRRHAGHGYCYHCVPRPGRVERPMRYEIDDMAVVRAVCGVSPGRQLTTAERMLAVDILTRYGLPAKIIGERIHTTSRTVIRHRAILRKGVATHDRSPENQHDAARDRIARLCSS